METGHVVKRVGSCDPLEPVVLAIANWQPVKCVCVCVCARVCVHSFTQVFSLFCRMSHSKTVPELTENYTCMSEGQ